MRVMKTSVRSAKGKELVDHGAECLGVLGNKQAWTEFLYVSVPPTARITNAPVPMQRYAVRIDCRRTLTLSALGLPKAETIEITEVIGHTFNQETLDRLRDRAEKRPRCGKGSTNTERDT